MHHPGPGGFVARCRYCALEVEVDTQRDLDELMDRLGGVGTCTDEWGHDLEQESPRPRRNR